MDTLHKVLFGLLIFIFIAALIIGFLYMRASADTARAEGRDSATKEVLAQSADQIKAILQQQKDRDAADQAYHQQQDQRLADMAKTVALLKTPQQQVAWSQDQLKDALKGITIAVGPNGNATANIPAATIPDLPQVIQECKECKLKLDAALHDVSSRDQTISGLKTENLLLTTDKTNLTKDNQSLKDAMKGGSFFQRTKRLLLDAACGAGGAAVGTGINKNAKGAAIGAAVGVIGCAIANK